MSGCQKEAPWHLRNKGSSYSYANSSRNVTVYVVDTWVDIAHKEFQGRARLGFQNAYGQHYHGTHVAGIIASKSYGVAKRATIISVQVLNGDGRGPYSGILDGLSWISRSKKGIVNISINGPFSVVVNRAVEALNNGQHIVIVAAGNAAADACTTSPSGASVITVGAVDQYDKFAYFSNHGTCVTLNAPGVAVQSTLPSNKQGFLSGTSMASPVVAGIAAVYASRKQWPTAYELRNWLITYGRSNSVRRLPPQTANIICKQILTDASCSPIKGGSKTTLVIQQ